ncbi:zinc finger, YgiT-type [Spirosoma radiotolerans]|uniref:Zinc finger, YgiT-type n=2 Tax=Spirosoma radiotolerans TaxID=1379870 RepID=A0A0E4A186_9BACT|nr:zinc finger, YgiT-type [Spirosoma radiotolerans]
MNWPNDTLLETHVRYILDMNGQLYVFENVPARVNLTTDEQFFTPATVRRIQQIALSAKPPTQTIQVGLYEWGNAA